MRVPGGGAPNESSDDSGWASPQWSVRVPDSDAPNESSDNDT
ncbi:hypothetical protein F4561_000284 [Lipingzhangella halophila]|uniref:Uncharacterized protein n=1 Tax=Lipingzhangella halophila TaxID=1783352 RepID=A0A7W7RCJ4_9ACTN|nr:hypothetical protein [Lipingzhangella halophila]MBB4929464.1 hypothetical protein [Lipingzhangella halophila]